MASRPPASNRGTAGSGSMKIYTGWVLKVEGQEQTVIGSLKIRGTQSYVLKSAQGERTGINREELLAKMVSKEITYVRSVSV